MIMMKALLKENMHQQRLGITWFIALMKEEKPSRQVSGDLEKIFLFFLGEGKQKRFALIFYRCVAESGIFSLNHENYSDFDQKISFNLNNVCNVTSREHRKAFKALYKSSEAKNFFDALRTPFWLRSDR